MKFIASSSLLLKELQMIGGIINNTTTLPILENFMFDINNNKLTLTASDLETTFSTQINIESEDISREQLLKLTGGYSVPQIIINGKAIGGYDNLLFLYQNNKLNQLINNDK